MTGAVAHPSAVAVVLPALVAALPAVGYLLLVRQVRRRSPQRGWSTRRTASFVAGCGVLAIALSPPLAPWAHHDFRGHMAQHLLVGMYAPPALVLGAPVTLLLRALPATRARRLTALLRSPSVRGVTHPVVALLLNTGSLAALYCTPLYGTAMAHPAGHWLLHVHFLASGCLFAWVVAGPDPAPARPGVPARLVLLGFAIAGHAVLSQLMYGGFLIDIPAPVTEVRGGAELMYYGGDFAELLLAAALVSTWRPVRNRPRSQPGPHGARAGFRWPGRPADRPAGGGAEGAGAQAA
ncbi:cytochrome c oxidase assembly protein [Streptomyces smyrnaeus]|uniref:Cytochrome c oxidase assembly protein n=1 Tax=Streptomyces smyrnaeus TaxID=1387713 RepID=A0ABS3XNS6_9ACTN|nr:cytochrome c oxidase assembly protein [Streptomyces smyrnaeus]MBO8196943.1 cytochrome c oxidase assembly protein [Streptomyces smyrnaeus]